MALLPFVLDELLEGPSPRHHHFGVGLHPNELWVSPSPRHLWHPSQNPVSYLRPWLNNSLANIDGAEKKSHIGKDGFQVCLDVQHFAPNEIEVKTVDNSIVVHAKHEERQDEHGHISRQFTRRYDLPKGFNVHDVVSTISSDGILTVKAPPTKAAIEGNVRHVQIQQTGPAHLSIGNKDKDTSKASQEKMAE